MIITVIPLVRLPKRIGLFSYRVEETLQTNVQVGQLITIPFRTSHIQGIIFSIQKIPASGKEKYIIDIVNETPLLSETYLTFLFDMATLYGVSLATLTKMTVLPLQKTKLKKMSLVPYKKQEKKETYTTTLHTYHSIKGRNNTITSLIKKAHGQLLILIPEIHDADAIRQALPISVQQHTTVWHSTLSTKQKFERWLTIRNGETRVVIATRSGVLLPFFDLEKILIVEEEHEQHKQSDQAPRFHVHDVARMRQAHTKLLSASPSVATYFAAYRGDIQTKETHDTTHPPSPPTIIDISGERAQHHYSCFSLSVERYLEEATEDVLIYLNRRGFASSLRCQVCGFVQTCPSCTLPMVYTQSTNQLRCTYCKHTAVPTLVCPSCQSNVVKLRGAGTQLVESTLRTLLPNTTHEIIRIDGDVHDLSYVPKQTPRMIIGTERAFQYVRWENTAYILFVDIDRDLALPEFLATESVYHTLNRVQLSRRKNSTFAIQTRTKEHPFFQSIGDASLFYKAELHTRHRLAYPPYSYLVRYFFGSPNKLLAEKEALRIHTLISSALTKEQKPIKLHYPLEMHPPYYRGKHWYAILVKIKPTEWKKQLLWLNGCMPPEWKIDPHPTSLLSP